MEFGAGASPHKAVTAPELERMLSAGEALVIDVREADEFASGHIPGALNMPLSTFQASKLPAADGRKLVLNCMGGKRSAMALDKCAMAQNQIDTHLAGGFAAWQAARLPVER